MDDFLKVLQALEAVGCPALLTLVIILLIGNMQKIEILRRERTADRESFRCRLGRHCPEEDDHGEKT